MRRYGVPADMIERATERRLAGDWRGACEAANIDTSAVGSPSGDPVPSGDLVHLVPDLLRWHLPEAAETLHAVGAVTPLSVYPDGTALCVHGPASTTQPQRLRLAIGPVTDLGLHLSRELWDDRYTGDLLARCGGGTRLPFFPGPADDGVAALTERVLRLFKDGKVLEAWHLAGFDVDAPEHLLRHYRPGLTMLAERARHLAAATGSDVVTAQLPSFYAVLLDRLDGPAPRVRVVPAHNGLPLGVPVLPFAAQHHPAVLDRLRDGTYDPAQLHPLVGAALFPGTRTMPAPATLPAPVEITCGRERHTVTVGGGALHFPHPPVELTRERAIAALAGRAPTGCAAAEQGWRLRGGWLPTPLIHLRQRFLLSVMHGEAASLETLLDAGMDPRVLDPRGRTLLHLLPWLFPDDGRLRVLDRLVAAGLDVDATDRNRWTPLHYAVLRGGSESLIRALLAAGADPAPPGKPPLDLAPAGRRARLAPLLT